ncbi:hypothetical protein QA601_05900 [Chitinispirillales bacterium ANBcel5]|uniref:hypothetical protein n=1 Tax=Cellulosispirillum alkaliphilum TaxID=3039283 RepID=UPI002A543098|nr:hypothetical protein [Chitinispirillales bacterium ANBcel5]
MIENNLIFWIVQAFILLLGIAVGHSFILLKIRKEENKKRELELALLKKRAEILKQGKKVADDLEEVLYKAKIQQEIDDIIRKDENH